MLFPEWPHFHILLAVPSLAFHSQILWVIILPGRVYAGDSSTWPCGVDEGRPGHLAPASARTAPCLWPRERLHWRRGHLARRPRGPAVPAASRATARPLPASTPPPGSPGHAYTELGVEESGAWSECFFLNGPIFIFCSRFPV